MENIIGFCNFNLKYFDKSLKQPLTRELRISRFYLIIIMTSHLPIDWLFCFPIITLMKNLKYNVYKLKSKG